MNTNVMFCEHVNGVVRGDAVLFAVWFECPVRHHDTFLLPTYNLGNDNNGSNLGDDNNGSNLG